MGKLRLIVCDSGSSTGIHSS